MSEAQTKVIIIGCGIAGPVLALRLKQKGYHPVIYERHSGALDGGVGICLQPNGLRALAEIPGLVEAIDEIGCDIKKVGAYSDVPEDKSILGETSITTRLREVYGFGVVGIGRAVFHRILVEAAQKEGVRIVWDHQLEALQQRGDNVVVTFANGKQDTASFVMGCDGLHSTTRIALFGREPADFTGLTQTGGLSPTPPELQRAGTMIDIFRKGAHMIAYAVTKSHMTWCITQREAESTESWKGVDANFREKFKQGTFSEGGFNGGQLVKTAEKIVKFGLYDRPPLQTWHSGRIALLGDAAHPTSPHLGQGANQAFEDIDMLIHILEAHNPSGGPLSSPMLSKIFTEYEKNRIPRSAQLVKSARLQGEARVAATVEAAQKRNAILSMLYADDDLLLSHYKAIFDAVPRKQFD